MTAPVEGRVCARCRYVGVKHDVAPVFHGRDRTDYREWNRYQCRKNAPTENGWPFVAESDVCGEWVANEKGGE